MADRTIEVPTADGPMPLYEATPDGDDARAAVVVIQEAFGVNPHIEDVTRRFAAAGYHAVAPHVFHRSGGGSIDYGDFGPVMEHFKALSDDKFLVDVDAALAHLRDAGWSDEQIGIVGFCMGGRVTFLVAANRPLGAAVGFYGGGIVNARFPQFPALIDHVPSLQSPWLGLFGSADQSIPVEDVERLRDELVSAPVDTEVVLYEGAEHGFHCDARESYHREAATDGWQRTLEWFAEHLK